MYRFLRRQLDSQKTVALAIERLNGLSEKDVSSLPMGCSCRFLALSKNIGVKVYSEQYDRNVSVRMQAKAVKLSLGPLVGKSFRFRWKHGDWKVYHCYLTERVQVSSDKRRHSSWTDKLAPVCRQIRTKFAKHRIEANDLWRDNLGRKNGKFVVIDFNFFEKMSARRQKEYLEELDTGYWD